MCTCHAVLNVCADMKSDGCCATDGRCVGNFDGCRTGGHGCLHVA